MDCQINKFLRCNVRKKVLQSKESLNYHNKMHDEKSVIDVNSAITH